MTTDFSDKIKNTPWLLYPLVTISYFLLGKIAFNLTVDSGFAALVWPSAAIALAFMLHCGYRIWPAIYIGALLSTVRDLAVLINNPLDILNSPHLFLVAGGATLQTIIATWAIKKLDLFEHDFSNPKKIGAFFLVAGPLCSLTSASVATLTFYSFGMSSFMDLLDEWLIWWIADSTSMIIFITYIFSFFYFEKRRRNAIVTILSIGLMATVGIFYVGKQWENDRLNLLFDQEVISAVNILKQIKDRQISLLKNLDNFKRFHPNMLREDFLSFANDNLPLNSTIRSLAWIDNTSGDKRNQTEVELSQIYGRDIRLWERDIDYNPMPAMTRDEYYYVRYSEPYDIFPASIGFIANSGPARLNAMRKAYETKDIVVTPPSLVTGTDGGYLMTIIIYQAAFLEDEFKGYNAILIDLDTLMKEMLPGSAAKGLEVEIKDLEVPGSPTYSSRRVMDGFIDENPVSVKVDLFDRSWELTFRRTLDFVNVHKTVQPLYIGMAGMVLASLVAFGIVMLSGQRTYLEKLVAKRTRELEHANDTKSKFMANMSHDLRTPLNAIIGFSEIMKQEMYGSIGDKKYKEYIKDINQSSEYLLSLINDILDFSAIDANKRTVEKENIAARPLIEDCLRSLNPLMEAKNITATLKVRPDFPDIYADPRAMKQIFINLVSNSIKFTPEGGSITVDGHITPNHIELSVSDTGKGIDKDDIGKILDPFTRVDNHPHISQEGTGLGLAIVNSLVKLHSGHVTIESELNKGTKVIIRLPRN